MFDILHEIAIRAGLGMTRCPICGMLTDKAHGPVCPACAKSLQARTGGYCPQCGLMFGTNHDQPTRCARCRLDPPPWDNLHFHGCYSGRLRDMILGYKFNGGHGQARLLADMACQAFVNKDARLPDIIVPVPLHQKRLLWRGFNQSIEFSRRLGRKLDRPVSRNGLIRTRHTIPQTRLGLKERQINIKAAFAARQDIVEGKIVLIVDDVYTTGSTLNECAKTLKRAKAAGVDVLVLARAQKQTRDLP